MVHFISSIYKDFKFAFIDGRSVSFCLRRETKLQPNKKVFSILLDVNRDIQLQRVRERHYTTPELAEYDALSRDERDQLRCLRRYGLDIFQKRNYDFYLNTSHITMDETVSILFQKIKEQILEKVAIKQCGDI